MCMLEKLNFKIFRGGGMPQDHPSVLAPSALDPIFARINSYSQLLSPDLLLPMGNSRYNITHLLIKITKNYVFSSQESGAPSVLHRHIYLKDC